MPRIVGNNADRDLPNGIIDFSNFRPGRRGNFRAAGRMLGNANHLGMGGGKFRFLRNFFRALNILPKFNFKSAAGYLIFINIIIYLICLVDYMYFN